MALVSGPGMIRDENGMLSGYVYVDLADRDVGGVVNAWTMPIKARIDMLSTGVRTPVGIKILGSDLREIERLGTHLEMILNQVPGVPSSRGGMNSEPS
jgi:Cu/Ag efflux pump CusA